MDASPICRGQNLTMETVLTFMHAMPKQPMAKADFNAYAESRMNGWTQTHSQIARQMALYYEEGGVCYPRFGSKVSLGDIVEYAKHWATRYFIPNPYTPSLKDKTPTTIYAYLKKAIHEGKYTFSEACNSIFPETSLNNLDKVRVYLVNFTDILVEGDKMSINNEVEINENTEIHPSIEALTPKEYFYHFGGVIESAQADHQNEEESPLQQIFYGAPGTGKSHTVDLMCQQYEHFRTTFHPDSDYSTFVGCYKPTKNPVKILSVNELAAKWQSLYPTYPNRPEIRFASVYHKSLIAAGSANYPNIFIGANTNVINAEVPKGIVAGESLDKVSKSGQISYEFVPQAFTIAYIAAWKKMGQKASPTTKEPTNNIATVNDAVFLVIEEINRGNCAQIFGDLFQLLDREDTGFSKYEITPDTDIENYIVSQGLAVSGITNSHGDDISNQINDGTLMKLPPNLYIWATMNTSDQSLFPIDSAFKRRWDWKYVPIDTAKESWTIKVNGKEYSWTSFLNTINEKIYAKTQSEDKQLGFYFCKAEGNVISAERFVSKVLFYVYNDVFKDYGFDDSFFNSDNGKLTFQGYYKTDGKINEEKVAMFLDNLEVEEIRKNVTED